MVQVGSVDLGGECASSLCLERLTVDYSSLQPLGAECKFLGGSEEAQTTHFSAGS